MTGPGHRSASASCASASSASGRWGATIFGSSDWPIGHALVAVADPDPDALAAAIAATGAQAFAEPLALLAEADLDAVVIAAPTTTHLPLALAAIERGIAVLVEKPLAATPDEADRIVAAASVARCASGPGRSHRALQPGGPRARTPAGRRLAVDRLRHHQPSSRSVPGAHPRRRRDRRPRHARRRHALRAIAGERPARVSAETAQRIHASHEDLLFGLHVLPVRHGRDARRRLADAGQAAPADGRRRGGHVRARLPDPAADLRARGRHDQPAPDRWLRADVRAAMSKCCLSTTASRSPPSCTPSLASSGTAAGPSWMPRTAGGPSSSPMRCCALPASAEPWSSSPRDIPRDLRPRPEPARRFHRPALPSPAGMQPRGPCRHGRASPVRPGPWPSWAPARWACPWPPSSRRHGWSVIAVDVDPGVIAGINAGRSHIGEEPGVAELVAEAHAAGRLRATLDGAEAARAADVVVLIVPVMLDDESRPDHRIDGFGGRSRPAGHPRGVAGHLRDDPAGRRHPWSLRAADRRSRPG